MLTKLNIEDFKGIQSLQFESLERINLLAGANDVGKTSAMEALFFLFVNDQQSLSNFPTVFRNGKGEGASLSPEDQFVHFWSWLVYQGAPIAKIVAVNPTFEAMTMSYGRNLTTSFGSQPGFRGVVERNKQVAFQFLINQNGGISVHGAGVTNLPKVALLSTHPSSPITDATLYNTAVLHTGAEETLEKVLRVVEPRLKKLRYLKAPKTSQPLVHADVGISQLVPSSQMGQGFNRVLNICCQILASQAQIILVDEIENGIHHDALPQVWSGIKHLCREADVQMFATTHSLECIRSAHEAYEGDDKYDFALHRLQRVKGTVEVVTHSREMLAVALNAPLEVR